MVNPILSVDDGLGIDKFDSIFEVVMEQERNRDEEFKTSIRLPSYHQSVLTSWRSNVNTNDVEVFCALFKQGTKVLRELDIVEKADRLLDVRSKGHMYISDNTAWMNSYEPSIRRLHQLSVVVEEHYSGELTDPITVSLPFSYVSEVKRFYESDLFISNSVYRLVITAGFLCMEDIPEYYYSNVINTVQSVNEATDQSIHKVEELFVNVIYGIYGQFLMEEATREDYEWLRDLQDVMYTDRSQEIGDIADKVETHLD